MNRDDLAPDHQFFSESAGLETEQLVSETQYSQSHLSYTPVIIGVLMGLLVCFPWIGPGRLWLLDWSPGPYVPLLPSSFLGLHGGIVTSLPLSLALGLSNLLAGSFATVLPALVFFPLALAGAARLTGGGLWPRVAAGLLYCLNPFVYDRLFVGQFGVLLGYALLPWAISSLLRVPDANGQSWLATALWWVALIGMAPHFVWIFGVVVGIAGVVLGSRLRVLFRLAVITAATALCTTYALLAGVAGGVGQHIGARNLAGYATRADPHLGLLVNVASLFGFWRRGPLLAKQVVGGWFGLWLAILLLAAVGFAGALRNRERGKAVLLLSSGVIGLLLAMGDQGPTGSLFHFAYFHVPYFAIMREPQKFDMLWALAVAVGFGWGVSSLLGHTHNAWSKTTWITLALALPVACEPLAFGGLVGQVKLTRLPRSWQQVNAAMGPGPGRVLVLPWHLYLAFPYTQNRAIANPASQLLRRPVISGDNVQLPHLPTTSTSPRSVYLTKALAQAPFHSDFGAKLAPLGVTYVLVEKTVDWRNYGWLHIQSDLHTVYNSPSLRLYRNTAFAPQAAILSNNKVLATGKRTSAITYRLPATPAGATVQISEPYQAGWVLDRRPGRPSRSGTVEWKGPLPAGIATFTPWRLAVTGAVISVIGVAGLVATVIGSRIRRPKPGQD